MKGRGAGGPRGMLVFPKGCWRPQWDAGGPMGMLAAPKGCWRPHRDAGNTMEMLETPGGRWWPHGDAGDPRGLPAMQQAAPALVPTEHNQEDFGFNSQAGEEPAAPPASREAAPTAQPPAARDASGSQGPPEQPPSLDLCSSSRRMIFFSFPFPSQAWPALFQADFGRCEPEPPVGTLAQPAAGAGSALSAAMWNYREGVNRAQSSFPSLPGSECSPRSWGGSKKTFLFSPSSGNTRGGLLNPRAPRFSPPRSTQRSPQGPC